MDQDTAIAVDKVTKDFHLKRHRSDSIKRTIIESFQNRDRETEILHALRGISFEIKNGEFFGILGRNGSGKSTLLKILANIYQPTSGRARHHGKLVSFIELGVGFNPNLTGRENVYLNGALLGFSRKEIDERYKQIVEFSELEKFMDQPLKNYSSGMSVRLAFSVATHADADIILLDEVLAVGDAAFQRKCYGYFKSLKRQKKTIVFVTHSMSAVREYCDRAILIENGKIRNEGPADDVANAYTSLFNSRDAQDSGRQDDERWGSGEAQFTSANVDVNDETVTISLEFEAIDKDLPEVIVGLDIHDQKDRLVSGIDSGMQKEHSIKLTGKKKHRVQYSFTNMLGGGDFSVTISLKSPDSRYVYDFWKRALLFKNTKSASTFFPVILPVKIKK